MSDRKRLLNDLRVIDLRAELEKRNLDKTGVRGVLLNRLSKHLEEEGHDPATFEFEIGGETKTPVKRGKRSESAVDPEPEETPSMEDMIVQDDAGEEDEVEQPSESSESKPKESKMEVDEAVKVSRKRESKDELESRDAKKPCVDKVEKDDDLKAENNTDAEDSINLDIGEDELLNEETDTTSKTKKDEAEVAEADKQQGDSEQREDSGDHQVTDEAPTSSETGETNEKDKKDEKEQDDSEKKEKKEDSKEGGARNLWVSGLSGDTRAKDLKQLCSKHGKVIGAKVVTNARTPGSRCYGYVTMASSQDAESCIKHLHRTELHGRIISVEKAKSESESAARRQPARDIRTSTDKKEDANEQDSKTEGGDDKKKDGEAGKDSSRAVSRTREKSSRSDKDRHRNTRSRDRKRSPREVLSFSKIWKERDMARARERSRLAREEERRRRAADDAMWERERRQRQEKVRLQLEREKLRQEREKIEREKNELLRLERERHRLEREKLELERLELKRAQLRLEEERRKRGYEGAYRKSPPPPPSYDPRHKRPVPATSSNRGQFEAPPPPRFENTAAYDRDKRERDRDYKREYVRHVSASNVNKYPANGSTNDDSRQPVPPGTRPKEPSRGGYESRGSGYRSPPKEARAWPTARPAYPDPTKRGGGVGGNEAWNERGGTGGGAYRDSAYFQPPPPGAYADRADRTAPAYVAPTRDYRKY